MNDNLDVIILAAGLGTRMKSATIKILHRAAGRPIIDYVLDLAADVCDRAADHGHRTSARSGAEQRSATRARFAIQEEQLGTGHAVLQAAESARERRRQTRAHPLRRRSAHASARRSSDCSTSTSARGNALTLLTMKLDDPAMYGRIVRDDDGSVVRIVEAKDASDEEKKIGEVNAGIYVFDGEHLFDNLRNLSNEQLAGRVLPDRSHRRIARRRPSRRRGDRERSGGSARRQFARRSGARRSRRFSAASWRS